MADLIENSNNTNLSFIRGKIENTLKNIFGEINYSMLVGKKELLDNIMELMTRFIGDSNKSIGENNKKIVDKTKNNNITDSDVIKFDYSNNNLEWEDISLYFYPDNLDKEILSPLIKSIMKLDQSLEKNKIEMELKRTELNMKDLGNDLEGSTLNEDNLKMNNDYYKLTTLEKNE